VVPNPIDLDEFKSPIPRGRFRTRFGLPDASSAPLVMFLGKLTPRKRVDVLVRAFSQLARRDARLVIAGNDMGAGAGTRELVRALELGARTTFTGLLRGQDRLEALADADVLVYASEDEVFGLVPLEALLSGTPVIVADDSGCGEVVSHVGGGQVVPPGDVDALRRAISATLEAPSAGQRISTHVNNRIRCAYGDDVVSAAVEQLYSELVTPS
jgi:glycosyltransferase involved in cell wall biosynthesis